MKQFFQAAISVTVFLFPSQCCKEDASFYPIGVIQTPYFIQRGTLRALNCLHNASIHFAAPKMYIIADMKKNQHDFFDFLLSHWLPLVRSIVPAN